jgi:hypothetical protein
MASLIPGYEYDIFISYRQKDNKHDGWVTEFVDNLKGELEATFKEDVSVYFDINPHDGLLESHEVGDSLREKLKCLIFIPIISRTYCDPKSFAWEHEFQAFVEQASNDRYGLKVRLPGGNVASRVLPVRIYDLNKEDIKLCESVLGGVLRGIEFIYKSAGVNRPLRANEDHAQDNLNKIYYRDQINKMSHSIQEIIQGLRTEPVIDQKEETRHRELQTEVKKEYRQAIRQKLLISSRQKVLFSIIIITILLIAIILAYPKIFKRSISKKLDSEKILEQAITASDPYSSWQNYTGKFNLKYIDSNGKELDEIIEIQTKEGFYKRTYSSGNLTTVRGIRKGECFREVNGNTNPGKDLIRAYKLDCETILTMKEHHYCHFGLLMELRASGLVLDEKVNVTKFQGNDCLALSFTCDSNKVKINYFKGADFIVYLDPINFSMKGYKWDIIKVLKQYVVFTGNLKVNELNFPMCEIFYNSSDNSFQGIDLITKAD